MIAYAEIENNSRKSEVSLIFHEEMGKNHMMDKKGGAKALTPLFSAYIAVENRDLI